MEVLNVNLNDAKELLNIYGPYVIDTAISFETEVPSIEEFKNRILNISSKYPYIKAVEEGKILGYAYAGAFKTRAAYDWSVETTIYLKPEATNKGVGRILYEELEARLQAMGILNANACIAVPKERDSHLTDNSLRFHEHMGYKLVGRFHDSGFKFNTWYDMVWMEKMLGEHTDNPKPVCFGMQKVM